MMAEYLKKNMAAERVKEMEVNDVVRLFSKYTPKNIEIKNTSHGDDDFRETLIVDFGKLKMVIKLSANGFTDEKHLILWERIADEDGNFKGVYDFNIGGREVYINYIIRQAPYVSTAETYDGIEKNDNFLKRVLHALDIVRNVYPFSDPEKEAAPLLYKCIRPLWWHASEELKEFGSDSIKIQEHLDKIEYEQTREINFAEHM